MHNMVSPRSASRSNIATPRVPAGNVPIEITYLTSPEASALQWLEPSQTAGGEHPYLFSQCQAIHARALVPIQDAPRARVKYSAEIEVDKPLRVVMAAANDGEREGSEPTTTTWLFHMPQAIPPYLIALAAGMLVWYLYNRRNQRATGHASR